MIEWQKCDLREKKQNETPKPRRLSKWVQSDFDFHNFVFKKYVQYTPISEIYILVFVVIN